MRPAKKIKVTAFLLVLSICFQGSVLIPFLKDLPFAATASDALSVMCLYLCVIIMNEPMGGLVISVFTPIAAYIFKRLEFFCLIPFVIIGNAVLVTLFYFLQKRNKYTAVLAASAARWAVLLFAVKYLLRFFVIVDYDRFKLMSSAYNRPSLAAALVGGIIALIVNLFFVIRRKNSKF